MFDLKTITRDIALPLHLGDSIMAAQMALEAVGQKGLPVRTAQEAHAILTQYLQALLDNDLYVEAASLLWRPTQFTAEPQFVQDIFADLFAEKQILIQGAASVGKSFSVGVWHYLDWRRDPEFTNVQVVGPSEDHLRRNLFSHIINLHNSSAIPAAGVVTELCISLQGHDKHSGIHGLVIPLGKKSAGRLQGVKVKPRPNPHPVLGKMTRLRVILEEAENIHVGVWEDLINLSANAGSHPQQFKVTAAYNPKDQTSQVGVRAEPEEGWQSVDIDSSFSWRTKRGWKLRRLDGLRSENVQKGTEIYNGLQTVEGLRALTLQAGGENTAGYYCADDKTECLTQRGWLTHDKIKVGDKAWALNLKEGTGNWSTVREVFAKPYSGDLVSVEGRSLSALVTANHRWPVSDKLRVLRGTGYAVKEAAKLSRNNLLPIAVEPSIRGGGDVDFAALLGWVITDGTVSPVDNRITIYQSQKANAQKCRIIEGMLERLNAKSSARQRGDMMYYRFSKELGARVKKILPYGKPFPWAWVASASAPELTAFLEAAILGDGGTQGGSTPYVCSTTKEHADGFAAVATMIGMASTTHEVAPRAGVFPCGRPHKGAKMYIVCFIRPKHTLVANNKITTKHYEGIVWCPRTDDSTWLCRRDGHVHYTGNTMARGWYPVEGLDLTVIPVGLLNDEDCRGDFEFVETPENFGSLDVALEGGDNAVFILGRYGRASGYRSLPTLTHPKGEFHVFADSKGRRYYRNVLQVDQIVMLPKGRTEELGDNVIKAMDAAGVPPENMAVDRTGNGAGVHDRIRSKRGDRVIGINGSTSATQIKILEEDLKVPFEEYVLLTTELWFAVRKWLETKSIRFSSSVTSDPLYAELSGRRFQLAPQGRLKVESKAAYKSRGNKSPDRADSLTQLVHAIRVKHRTVQSFSGAVVEDDRTPIKHRVDVTNRFESLD